ncbi:diacylglycerol kinase family lipid kinase [Metabacillus sp. GX 13764]|uniref:diacylglycerol/lipid kinase family protein n=1 Tax=Metabacillus kandeliae TaxID=2900151 RepID=UPI001E4A2487|nr:diacylglycerol kinase family protein [Metabacillus kandeliae]MCD7032709.1 diacylglycerol kinase family lipid kinase [Metabacillus kandeliae]
MNGIVLIVNPVSGNGKAMKAFQKTSRYLTKKNISFRSFFTEYRGHAEVIARQVAAVQNYRLETVIGIGGDGTIHEIINGLSSYPSIKIGFIPAGTGNDFRRGFRLPAGTLNCLNRILSVQSDKVDAGEYFLEKQNSRFFINSMGAGFDACVAAHAGSMKAKKWLNACGLGFLIYPAALIKVLGSYQPVRMKMEVDDHKMEFGHVWFAAISNQPYYGGGMKIAPDADPKNGTLTVTVVHSLSKLKLLLVFITVFFGKHTLLKEVEVFSGTAIAIETDRPVPVHADGEACGTVPVKINLCPRKVRIIA